MIENHPLPVFGLEPVVRFLVDRLQIFARLGTGLYRGVQLAHESARSLETFLDLRRVGERSATSWHQLFGFERRNGVERVRPILKVRVARVGRGTEFNEVAAKQDFLLRQPRDGVTLRTASSELHDLDFELTEPERHLSFEGHRGPCETGNRLDRPKQSWEALDLALHVRFSTLDNQVIGILTGDDVFRLVGRGPEYPDGVVMREQHILDRLVRDLPDATNHVLRHDGRCLRVRHKHRVVADDDAGVWIAFCGVRIGIVGKLVEADGLLFQISLRCKFLFGRGHEIFL